MKKYRRGSKIVDIVKGRFKSGEQNEQVSLPPVTTSSNTDESYINDAVLSFTQFTVQQQNSNDQIDFIETAQQDVACNVNTMFHASGSSLPSTSAETSKPIYLQDKLFGTYLHRASDSTLLNDDLYLTDSSDEIQIVDPGSNAGTTSFFDPYNNSSRHCEDYGGTTYNPNGMGNHSSAKGIIMEADTTNNLSVEPIVTGHQNPKRKRRQAKPNEWKKNLRKNKRQRGEPYLSAKGVLVPGRTLKESKCIGQCIHECASKFSEDERLTIFSSFWNISSVAEKRLYVVNLIERGKTKAIKGKQIKKKTTNKYFMQKIGATEKIRVCQKFFIATLSVSESFVRFCLKKVMDNSIVIEDKRGKNIPHNKITKEIREHVRDHIKSFPRMPAPRVQKDTKKEYLGRNLNLTKMYHLYKIKCDSQQRESVELSYYRSVFNQDFNIGFHRAGRDTCDLCVTVEHMSSEERESEIEMYQEHLKRVTATIQHRNEGKRLAQLGLINYAEFDLKAICDSSKSSTKPKRTTPLYNFTVINNYKKHQNVHCYCWHEGIAKKGATEIGSCLYKYLKSNASGKPITFMSDTCASQCRNMYIAALLLYCVRKFDVPEINQKYFEQGHSHLETDSIHAKIEKAKQNIAVYHPSGFYNIIRKCLYKYPSNVYEMNTDDFIDLKNLKNTLVKNAKIDYRGKPVNWYEIRWLQYRKDSPDYMYFKCDLNDLRFNKIEVIRKKLPPKCEQNVIVKKLYHKTN